MKLLLRDVHLSHPSAKPGVLPAIRALNLQVTSGEQIAVIGPSGAGKTTLLHGLACALPCASGEVLFDESNPWLRNTAGLHTLRRQIFLAPQVPPLPPRQRVVTSVLAGAMPHWGFWQSLHSLIVPRETHAAFAALAQYDLGEKLFERVDRLSGGERQRVGLARILLSQTRLWLVDEPLSALDPARAQQALATLTQCARERSATLICTLHHVERALAMFPRVIGLREGQLVFDLPAPQVSKVHLATLYAQHEHELTAPQPLEIVEHQAPIVLPCQ